MPAGRPPTYSPEILEAARKYVDGGYGVFPSIAGLAVHLNVSRQTVRIWAQEAGKEEFSSIIDRLQALQERELLDKGLMGTYNSTIAKVVLTKHGYTDKVESAITGKDGGPVETTSEVRITFVDSKPDDTESV